MSGFQYQLFHLYQPYREQNLLMDSLLHILFDHNNEKAIDHSNYLFYCHNMQKVLYAFSVVQDLLPVKKY